MKIRRPSMANALVIALLILGATPVCAAAAESFPTATPESQGLSSQTPMSGTWTYQLEKIETRLRLEKDPFTIK